MRRLIGGDRGNHNDLTAANVDGPENETFVDSGVEPTTPADLEIEIDSGDVFIEGSPVSVSSQTETVTDISGEVTESAYRYHTLSVDSAGELVVQTSPTGEFDPEAPSEEPITQVSEPQYPAGNCYIGFAFQVEDRIERVYDGRYVIGELPNSIITQGEESGLDADTVRQKTPTAISGVVRDFTNLQEETVSTYASDTEATLVDISGSGTMVKFWAASGSRGYEITIEHDGNTVEFTDGGAEYEDDDNNASDFLTLPPLRFEDSLKITYAVRRSTLSGGLGISCWIHED